MMTTSTLYSLKLGVAASLVLCLGCNAISGIEDFSVGHADEDADAASDADPADTRVGTSLDGGSDAPTDSGVPSPDGADSGPSSEVDVAPPPTSKRVFVTSESYTADLGGLAGADAKCQKLADAAKLGGTYRAWLSDSTTSAKTRLSHASVPYKLVDGTTVAADWSELTTSAGIAHAIDVTEKGGKPPSILGGCGSASGATQVWSNTSSAGDRMTKFACEDWTSKTATDSTGAGGLYFGRTDKSDGQWTTACSSNYCWSGAGTLAAALYCVEQ